MDCSFTFYWQPISECWSTLVSIWRSDVTPVIDRMNQLLQISYNGGTLVVTCWNAESLCSSWI